MCPQPEHRLVVGVHWSILTRSLHSFLAIHWALLKKSAKPRSPTFLPQSRCIALRFRVSNTSMSNVNSNMRASLPLPIAAHLGNLSPARARHPVVRACGTLIPFVCGLKLSLSLPQVPKLGLERLGSCDPFPG